MTKRLWIETDYYEKFRCKCSDCKRNCCNGWKISVSKKDYYRLLTMECSKELADKIERAFIIPDFVSDDHFRMIAPNYLGNCPMLDENGLCLIHKELGENALAKICKTFPRSLKQVGSLLEANCTNSCEAVVELLLKEDKLHFTVKEKEEEPNIIFNASENDFAQQLLFLQIMQDRSIPLSQRLLKICQTLGCKENSVDPINAFCRAADFVKTASVHSDIYEEYLNVLNERYPIEKGGFDQYKKDETSFEMNYPKWEIYFENILINHLCYTNLPAVDPRVRKEDCLKGLCLLYALMKIICSCMTVEDHSEENLAYVISDIFHLVEHGPFYYNASLLIRDETSLLNI